MRLVFAWRSADLGVQDIGVEGDAFLEPLGRDAEVLFRLGDGLAATPIFSLRLPEVEPALPDLDGDGILQLAERVQSLGELGLGLLGLPRASRPSSRGPWRR